MLVSQAVLSHVFGRLKVYCCGDNRVGWFFFFSLPGVENTIGKVIPKCLISNSEILHVIPKMPC